MQIPIFVAYIAPYIGGTLQEPGEPSTARRSTTPRLVLDTHNTHASKARPPPLTAPQRGTITMHKTVYLTTLMLLVAMTTFAQLNTRTVPTLDLERYMGHWYEIARYDHSFERGLSHTTATYTLLSNGKVKVVNAGITPGGKHKEAVGKAYCPNTAEPGKLRVAFFLWFYAHYYVLELAPDYRYALVGSNSDKYLWILSRTPQMAQEDIDHLLAVATQRGYDTSRLLFVAQ